MNEVRVYNSTDPKTRVLLKVHSAKELKEKMWKEIFNSNGQRGGYAGSIVKQKPNTKKKKHVFEPIPCAQCETIFTPKRDGNIYCDTACSVQKFKDKIATKLVDHICKGCKKHFKDVPSRRWCNEPCTSKLYALVVKSKPIPCERCTKIFKPKKKTGTLCQSPCNWYLMQRDMRRVDTINKKLKRLK